MYKILIIIGLLLFSSLLQGQQHFTFFFDQDEAKPTSVSIENFNLWMQNHDETLIVQNLKAYCDSLHSDSYNFILAASRNESIENILKENGFVFSKDYQSFAIGEIFEADSILSKNRKVEVYFSQETEIQTKDSVLAQPEEISDNPFLRKAQNPAIKPKNIYHHQPMNLNLFYKQFEEAKDGDRIQIFDIHFYIDTPQIILKSEPYLDKIVAFMEKNKEVSIKIEGHMCCNIGGDIKLSENRAKTIYRYLIKKGIARSRMSYEGFGVSKPIYEIPEKNSEEELKNRRVEIVVNKKNG
jgi:outer membrane protein OmpA-like peptidoglycan-associated protein